MLQIKRSSSFLIKDLNKHRRAGPTNNLFSPSLSPSPCLEGHLKGLLNNEIILNAFQVKKHPHIYHKMPSKRILQANLDIFFEWL